MKLDYLQRLQLGILDLKDKYPYGVMVSNVHHDGDCGIFKKKKCNCDPEITLEVDGLKFRIDMEGVIEK